jgi:hypothetical protein
MADPRCEVCGQHDPTAVPRPVPFATVACDGCWDDAASFPDYEPAPSAVVSVVEQIHTGAASTDVRDGTSTSCRDCGAAGAWHRTVNGRWVILEPGYYPAHLVPKGKRWRVAGDGTAVNLGTANPSDECRITHFDVCPTRPQPLDGNVLIAAWRRNAAEMLTRQ